MFLHDNYGFYLYVLNSELFICLYWSVAPVEFSWNNTSFQTRQFHKSQTLVERLQLLNHGIILHTQGSALTSELSFYRKVVVTLHGKQNSPQLFKANGDRHGTTRIETSWMRPPNHSEFILNTSQTTSQTSFFGPFLLSARLDYAKKGEQQRMFHRNTALFTACDLSRPVFFFFFFFFLSIGVRNSLSKCCLPHKFKCAPKR